MYTEIPCWENGEWGTQIFDTRSSFKDFVFSCFKEPGKYEFDETSFLFNEQARQFRKYNYFCDKPLKSRDYITYWDDQKLKCRKGAIFKHGNKTWYLTRDYYMWINFLRINDKEQKKFDFVQIRDAQYHMALYELLAELNYEHAAILKKRQIAASYFHMAKLINQIWFEETPILKMGASLKDFINGKGTWKFLEEYRSFLNEHTAWYRPMNPGKELLWQQQIEETINGRSHKKGLKGVLQGITFDNDPAAGVGGPCNYFFYEEAGIAPTMSITTEFLFPAMRSGQITTGLFIAAGSVGDLTQCEPLKNMIYDPKGNDIYAVQSDLLDDKWSIGMTGLFIPEQWSMPPYIDRYGNSIISNPTPQQEEDIRKNFLDLGLNPEEYVSGTGSLEAILLEREGWKKSITPEKYQYRISQHPINIAEAFANREISKFPQYLVTSQMNRIQDKEYPYEYLELYRNETGKIVPRETRKLPITEFPIKKDIEDKGGVLVVYERPDPDAVFTTYYGSVDPVSEGKTLTSDSLCSIYIYKNPVEVTRINGNETETFIERDKIVASWCGRYDDLNKTHEQLEMIIEWYNAWTVVENNISLFIQYMINKKKQRYLVPKNQIMFLKDLGSNSNVFQEYGWRNTGTIFRSHLLSYMIEFLKEEIDTVTKEDGTIVKIHYGIERIPDIMAMKEMQAYTDDLNVDRLVALSALIAFAKVQQSNRGYRKKTEYMTPNKLQNQEKLFKLGNKSPFRHIGSQNSSSPMKVRRSAYKNLR